MKFYNGKQGPEHEVHITMTGRLMRMMKDNKQMHTVRFINHEEVVAVALDMIGTLSANECAQDQRLRSFAGIILSLEKEDA